MLGWSFKITHLMLYYTVKASKVLKLKTDIHSSKELSLCHKLWIYNPYIFRTQCRKSFIFQTYIIWSNRIHSLKYQRSTTLESKDIGFRKEEFCGKDSIPLCFFLHSNSFGNQMLHFWWRLWNICRNVFILSSW